MAQLVLDKINKIYENGYHAVQDLSIDVNDGEFLVLVGPSGCGKSTALRMIAGLEHISSGTLSIGDRVVNDVHPKDRDIAMVFQNYALYPHMTVAENIGFALKLKRTPRSEIHERVMEVAHMLEIEEWLDRKPGQLSGGQRQRVAMGRAIIRRPSAFLMDEPLSNLDAKLRVQMRADIAKLQRSLGVTTVYVTHDQVEAMTMGHRVAVMRKGVLQQIDTPQAVYDAPSNLFVAAFIGSPAMNLIEGKVEQNDDLWIVIGNQRIRLSEAAVAAHPALKARVGSTIAVGVRPETLWDPADRPDHPDDQVLRAKVELREALGSDLVVHLALPGRRVFTEDVREGVVVHEEEAVVLEQHEGAVVEPEEGAVALGKQEAQGAVLDTGETTTLVARLTPHSAVREGDVVPLVVDSTKLHFFDLTTRDAIWT
jgi:multiple sugar transport system ATP-binding protein